jgi:hypothetical protein
MDVVIFFFVNYLVHAGSVCISPVASNLHAAMSVVSCLLDPVLALNKQWGLFLAGACD